MYLLVESSNVSSSCLRSVISGRQNVGLVFNILFMRLTYHRFEPVSGAATVAAAAEVYDRGVSRRISVNVCDGVVD